MAADLTITTSRASRLGELSKRIRRLRLPWLPLSIVIVLVVCAAFAPLVAASDPTNISMLERRIAPFETLAHPLGTDIMGRDMAS